MRHRALIPLLLTSMLYASCTQAQLKEVFSPAKKPASQSVTVKSEPKLRIYRELEYSIGNPPLKASLATSWYSDEVSYRLLFNIKRNGIGDIEVGLLDENRFLIHQFIIKARSLTDGEHMIGKFKLSEKEYDRIVDWTARLYTLQK